MKKHLDIADQFGKGLGNGRNSLKLPGLSYWIALNANITLSTSFIPCTQYTAFLSLGTSREIPVILSTVTTSLA